MIFNLLHPKDPDPSKLAILRTRTPAIQVQTPLLEGPRFLGQDNIFGVQKSDKLFFNNVPVKGFFKKMADGHPVELRIRLDATYEFVNASFAGEDLWLINQPPPPHWCTPPQE